MKINLNKNVVGVDGKELQDSNMGKIIANALASSQNGDALKLMDWALKLYNGKELDLDPSDLQVFKDFVLNNQSFTVLLRARILENIT